MNEQTPELPDTPMAWNWKRIGFAVGLIVLIAVIILVGLYLLGPTVGTGIMSNIVQNL